MPVITPPPIIPYKPQIVATRCGIFNSSRQGTASARTDLRIEGRRFHFIGNQAVSQLQMLIPGFIITNAGSGEHLLGNTFNYEGAIELIAPSTFLEAFFLGNAVPYTVQQGIAHVKSDPITPFDMAAGTKFWSRQACSVSVDTLFIPASGQPTTATDTGFISPATVSQVPATGNMTVPSGGTAFGGNLPIIVGIPTKPMVSVCILGDSIATGTGDTVDNASGAIGYPARGLVSVHGFSMPWLWETVGSDLFSENLLTNAPLKRALWQYVTHLICELGTNDIAAATSLATMQGYATGIWQAAKRVIGPYGKPLTVAQCLMTPRTTSTDSWATAANQTPVAGFAVGGVRDQFNAWVKTQVGGGLLDAFVDPNQYVEDPAVPGVWLTNGTPNVPTIDGLHPTQAYHILAAQAVNTWALAQNP